MIWALIIWIASFSFAAPSSTANLQEKNAETKVLDLQHFVVNTNILLSEEESISFSLDALEPKNNIPTNFAVTTRFYSVRLYDKHTVELNPLTLDLPPPTCSHFI